MKNTTILIGIVLVVAFFGAFVFMNGNANGNSVNAATDNEDVQKIVLGVENYNYYPQEVRVKAGQPVSISLDSSVSGCLRSFTIPELGVAKNLRTPSDTLVFTPEKPGRYRFQCSMNMGYGYLIVE